MDYSELQESLASDWLIRHSLPVTRNYKYITPVIFLANEGGPLSLHRSVTSEYVLDMMMSSNGNIFRVIDPLCGEFTGHRWITPTKASVAEFWYFLLSATEQTVE